ncbi:unnamed protein product [Staurois parvus]|uniref:Uncharacterized protein n=1 Tax=Staurois parvus TaxID=386267 RepID=A0ABN9CS15_9NEOB|nr:unnamed protein product [Staurois parvus]
MLLPGPQSLMGPCTASHCCCLPSPHSAMCHFQVSSHCWCVPFFCHRVLYGLPLLLPPPPHCGPSTLCFGPVTAQIGVEGVAGILRASASACRSYWTVSVLFALPQQDLQGI